MPKEVDPQDPELRQLPVQGLTGSAIRDKLNYKVNRSPLLLLLLLSPLMSVDILTAVCRQQLVQHAARVVWLTCLNADSSILHPVLLQGLKSQH